MLPEAGKYAGALQYMLRDPETMALLEKAPEAGRILRPLCHLLGVRPPAFLRRGGGVAAEMLVAAEAPITPRLTPAPRVDPRVKPEDGGDASLSTPEGGEGEGAEAPSAESPATEEVAPEAQPPPPEPGRSPAEEAARAYARRPGGLYWDGSGMRWS